MRHTAFFVILLVFTKVMLCQELRSTTAVTSNNQPVTVDLSNVSDARGASISIRNSSSSRVSLPQISIPNDLMPISAAAILKQLNGLPPVSTDQERAIQAWQYVTSHTSHFCAAGGKTATYDSLAILNGFGFGCCDQLATTLAWIWQQEGYTARVAFLMNFHDIPEIFYGNSWHMLDPDHNVYYLKDDSSIASVAEILADPSLVARTEDANGNDPVGWPATEMAQLYAQSGPTLTYQQPASPGPVSQLTLQPHEGITFLSENNQDSALYFDEGVRFPPKGVSSAEFNWDLSYGDPTWTSFPVKMSGLNVISDASSSKVLTNSSTAAGYIVYQGSSVFPVRSLSLIAQLGSLSGSGSLNAYFSADGINWSLPVQFLPTDIDSSFDLKADLQTLASGVYSYFVKVELNGSLQLHRLRIRSIVQTSRAIFPAFAAGSINQLLYQDSSPVAQARALSVITALPTGRSQIRGLHAESLLPESPTSSLALDYGSANLVDGAPESLAYPGSSKLDYLIQLNGTYNVTGISIDWGYFGTDPRYVQSWQILGRMGNQEWHQLASGGLPGQPTLDVPLNATATELRLVASSSNWIGAFDLRVFGGVVIPALPISAWTVRSNVAEDPVYSIARNYVAANLIDGNPNTLAYPAAKNLDYQISLGTVMHLTSASISWGVFGTNPGYVNSWSLLARNGTNQEWVTISQGGFPNNATTQLSLDFLATEVRLVAGSSSNWIGVYDFEMKGGQLMNDLVSTSNVPDGTAASSNPTSNLTDGDTSTLAYPGGPSLDYTIDSGQNSYIDAVRVVWGIYGSDSRYIQSWQLFGLTADGTWDLVAVGGYPNSTETTVAVHERYRKLRVTADGPNWLGIYEVQVFGSNIPAPGKYTVQSNVPEDPVHSLAQHYQASNLIDGDPSTLAYPGTNHIDYTVSLGQPTQLSSVFINWGVFGTSTAYVSSWSVLARNGTNTPWVTLATGGFPNNARTVLPLDFVGTDIRIIAGSANWIGLYELQIKGAPLP